MITSQESLVEEDISVSSFGSDSGPGGSSGIFDESTDTDDFREVRNLTKKETKDVETWRDLVTGVLVISASFVTTASFIYLSRDETETFQLAFQQYVVTIEDAAVDVEDNLHDGFTAVTDSITAHAQTSGSQWPFVTVPFFEKFGSHARHISQVDFFSFCPLVNETTRSAWEAYSVANQWWLEGDQVVTYTETQQNLIVEQQLNDNGQKGIPENIYHFTDNHPTTNIGEPPYGPRWQSSPPPSDLLYVNYDVLSGDNITSLFQAMVATNGPVVSEILPETHSTVRKLIATATVPSSLLLYPVYDNFNQTRDGVVGFLEILLNWKTFVSLLLPEGEGGVYYVLNGNCGEQQHTFEVSAGETIYLGEGDRHDILYDRHVQSVPLLTHDDVFHVRPCSYYVDVYPSAELRREFATNIPGLFTGVIAASFFLMAFFFFAYDKFVQRRNDKVVRQAAKTNAIVSSLFPTNVRDRLFGKDSGSVRSGKSNSKRGASGVGKSRLKSFLSDPTNAGDNGSVHGGGNDDSEDRPIADLFPYCTVLFADIVGFTAWSSMREPTQVFRLLESIYHAFDEIAKRRKVFKVETIGDCYVAVTGLPEPNKQHAVVMAKFARDCMYKMHEVTRSLEVSLGPDTGDLSMRFGLHSGPVTAGVLRGERSRFQLFGDTVNTASRMESTGRKGCIHISQETADEICNFGKSMWIRERADKVTAKGKGEMTTYWLSLGENSSGGDLASSVGDASTKEHHRMDASCDTGDNMSVRKPTDKRPSYYNTRQCQRDFCAKNSRLVEWNVDILQRLLKQIAAKRRITEKSNHFNRGSKSSSSTVEVGGIESAKPQMVLEEVSEVIRLPKFTSKVAGVVEKAEGIALTSDVQIQLFDFVTEIASMYHENPFHNFEHASHVTMSVVKLLSRIVAPADLDYDEAKITNEKKLMKTIASKMHDHTYGITSDPLTQFAVVLSALIHDVDHSGVPNAQLVKEGTAIAQRYRGKSVAEQNSVDLAWELLMKPDYTDLRKAICSNDTDWKRFRQLVVNSVMATDIVDKELKELRNARWDKAFNGDLITSEEDSDTDRNRKATIVIEHLIQASDVSHTMQHWHIYRKWNERLFRELYCAYQEGRAERDPSEFWYQGEIGFFQFYIIPLAKKLRECGVFGVSSDEYLNYAEKNLAEWKRKGEEATSNMLLKMQAEYGYL